MRLKAEATEREMGKQTLSDSEDFQDGRLRYGKP